MTTRELLALMQKYVDQGYGNLRVAYVSQRDGEIRDAYDAYPLLRSSGDDYFTLVGD